MYVTHDQEEALAISDRLAIMRDGQLEQVGSPADVYEQPDTTFVAEFVGASNVIPGTVVGSGPGGTMEISHASGLVFQAIEPAGIGVGQPAVTCVRPEKLLLGIADPDPGPWNTWSGEITRIVYLGEMTQYTIDVRGVALTVREPNQGRRTRQTSDRVTIRWAPVHTRILRSPL